MAFNVGEIVSTVTLEDEPGGQSGGGKQDWQRIAEARETLAKLARDRARTASEGFDD